VSLGWVASVRIYIVIDNTDVCNHHAVLSRLSSRFCSRLFREAGQVPQGHYSFPMLDPGLTLVPKMGKPAGPVSPPSAASRKILCQASRITMNAPCLGLSHVSHHVRHAVMPSSFLLFTPPSDSNSHLGLPTGMNLRVHLPHFSS
jgi:hypothetical protein